MNVKPVGPNQTELSTEKGIIFFSYRTPVAACIDGRYYRTEVKWSVTTSRHINQWLGGVKAEVKPQAFFDGLL